MSRIPDVAVLGAGLAGSSIAKAMGDQGWHTVLIDRHRFPRHKVCGEFLSPESLSTLDQLGLLEQVKSLNPGMIKRTRLIFSHGGMIEIPLPGIAMGISRFSLDAALHGAALDTGVELQLATSVTSVVLSDEGYLIKTRKEGKNEEIHARAVIAAWGGNERSGLPGYKTACASRDSYVGVKSHYEGIDMEPIVELYFSSGGYLGISPIEQGRVNVAALLTQEMAHQGEKSVLGMIEAAASRNPKLYRKLANAVPVPGTQAAVAPVRLSRKPLAWDDFPHVGDAALMIPPLCGDGMSMALRSAWLNSSFADSYLRGDISLSHWKQNYLNALKRDFTGPLRWGRILQRALSDPMLCRVLPALAQLAPGLAMHLVQATRLGKAHF